jgi:hypothetical protein
MSEARPRVENLAEITAGLKARYGKLDAILVDDGVRQRFLKPIAHMIWDLEYDFLPRAKKAGETPHAEIWIGSAGLYGDMATDQLNYLEKLVEKYGPDVTMKG